MAKVNKSWCRVFILLYDCFYFFALSQLLIIFSPKLGGCSCQGKTSSFLCNGCQPTTRERNVPRVLQGTELATSVAAPTGIPRTAFQSAVFEFAAFSPLFSVWVLLFFLTPGISFCADPNSRGNLHGAILLRQALCALLNDGCLREMVIMIDFEP